MIDELSVFNWIVLGIIGVAFATAFVSSRKRDGE